MGSGWNNSRERVAYAYTPYQVKAVLKNIGVDMVGETYQVYYGFCPFHSNRHTHSFSVNKDNGLFLCFNDACGQSGTLIELVKRLTGRTEMEAVRFIQKKGGETQQAYEDLMQRIVSEPEGFEEWQPETIQKLQRQYGSIDGWSAQEYMQGRGFNKETTDYFEIGYSENQKMITVPVHAPDGTCVGIVGRSIVGKDFMNSKHLPRNKTLFNIHRAKKIGDICIVCEASFDAMKIHQAGFPNVVAILGGSLSPDNLGLLDRYFSTIILMTDYDKKEDHKFKNCPKCNTKLKEDCEGHNPGRETGLKIASALPMKDIQWGVYDRFHVYPDEKKDPCELSEKEIQQCIHGAVSHLEYLQRPDVV